MMIEALYEAEKNLPLLADGLIFAVPVTIVIVAFIYWFVEG